MSFKDGLKRSPSLGVGCRYQSLGDPGLGLTTCHTVGKLTQLVPLQFPVRSTLLCLGKARLQALLLEAGASQSHCHSLEGPVPRRHLLKVCRTHLCSRLVLRFSGTRRTGEVLLWTAIKACCRHPRRIFRQLKYGAFGPNRMDTLITGYSP